MSWDLFKNNILIYSDNPESINDINQISNIYATEYDLAIRRGYDFLHGISVLGTNLPALTQAFQSAFTIGLNSGSSFSVINQIQSGIIAYWTGATMQLFPIPSIPAPGSVSNTAVTSNNVIMPGTWPVLPPIPPVDTTDTFVDLFITAATTHLTTISGIINTISLYPAPTGTVPGPGVIPWTGYVV